MALSSLHILERSADPDSPVSYEFFRNEEIKLSENACDAPPSLRDRASQNHLAPSPDLSTQVSSRFERLLDCEALGQVRGLAAALQLLRDARSPFAHLLA